MLKNMQLRLRIKSIYIDLIGEVVSMTDLEKLLIKHINND